MGYFISHNVPSSQIFESGTADTLPVFDAYRNLPSWMLFVQNTQPCAAALSNDTFECLMSASPSDLLAGINAGLAIEPYPFRPVLDGPEGIISDLPVRRLSRGDGGRVPFIAGTNLDEGLFVITLMRSMLIPAQGRYSFRKTFRIKIFPYG